MATKVKKEIVKRPPKTIKEKRFVKEYIKTGNATEAAVLAGYDIKNRDVARNIGTQNVAKLSIDDVMDKAGLTDELLVSHLTMGLMDAQKIDQYSGERMPDYQIKHKYLETSLKLKKYLGSDSAAINNGTVNNFSFSWKS